MLSKDQISTYYSNARELVKRGYAREARRYLMPILNSALEAYQRSENILYKAKNAVFMEKWIPVVRDLYDKGVTDYVLVCFGLPVKADVWAEKSSPKTQAKPSPQQMPKAARMAPPSEPVADKVAKSAPSDLSGGIDISGLFENINDSSDDTQGWCADVFERNKNAVVQLRASFPGGSSGGTGFIISDKGYLLTNHHVVVSDNGKSYDDLKMLPCFCNRRISVNVVASDARADVALCHFDPSAIDGFITVKCIADYSELKQGADCLILGNAFDMGIAPFAGMVRFTKDPSGDLVYTAPSNPGDSGGPVFNRKGECIGINKSTTASISGVNANGYSNATPIDVVRSLMDVWRVNVKI